MNKKCQIWGFTKVSNSSSLFDRRSRKLGLHELCISLLVAFPLLVLCFREWCRWGSILGSIHTISSGAMCARRIISGGTVIDSISTITAVVNVWLWGTGVRRYLSESFCFPPWVFFRFGVGILHSIENATHCRDQSTGAQQVQIPPLIGYSTRHGRGLRHCDNDCSFNVSSTAHHLVAANNRLWGSALGRYLHWYRERLNWQHRIWPVGRLGSFQLTEVVIHPIKDMKINFPSGHGMSRERDLDQQLSRPSVPRLGWETRYKKDRINNQTYLTRSRSTLPSIHTSAIYM